MMPDATERVSLFDRLVARWEVSWAGAMPSGFTLMTICTVSIGSLVLTLFSGKPGTRCALVILAVWTVFAVLDQARSLWTLQHPYASPRWVRSVRAVVGNDVVDAALSCLAQQYAWSPDYVVRRTDLANAIRAERAARRDAKRQAEGFRLDQVRPGS